jgi:hypothetical protein
MSSSNSHSNPSGLFFISSALCFAFSAGSGLLGFLRGKQIEALQNAHSFRGDNYPALKGLIEKHPEKRLYIKFSGSVQSNAPLKVKTSRGLEYNAVLTLKEIVYLQGLTVSAPKPIVSNVSTADEVVVEMGTPTSGLGPRMIVDPRCLELINRDHIDTEEKEIGSRLFSAAVSLIGVSWPYRCISNTMIVPQNRHVFTALDATVDLNGNISLVQPNAWTRRAVMTADQQVTVEDDWQFSKKVWTYASIGSGLASLGLAALGFNSSKKK